MFSATLAWLVATDGSFDLCLGTGDGSASCRVGGEIRTGAARQIVVAVAGSRFSGMAAVSILHRVLLMGKPTSSSIDVQCLIVECDVSLNLNELAGLLCTRTYITII